MKKMLYCVAALALALALTGCSWSVGTGSRQDNRSYDEIFTWGNESKIHTFMTYRIDIGEYGGMNLILDTSLGHSFALDGATNTFTVTDSEGVTRATGCFVSREQYSYFTSVYSDADLEIRNVNNRDLALYFDNTTGKYLAFTYLADCGLDVGLIVESDSEESLRYIAFSGEALPESSADIHHYLGTPAQSGNVPSTPQSEAEPSQALDETEPSQPQEGDAWDVTFANGKGFDVPSRILNLIDTDEATGTKTYDVPAIIDHNPVYGERSNLLQITVKSDSSATETASQLAVSIKAQSGETPVMDIHEEGAYITGIYENMLTLVFIADGTDGLTYVMCLYTDDMDNCIDLFYYIIDQFLASGITENNGRTAYGQPVNDPSVDPDVSAGTQAGGGNFPSYTIPEGFNCTYEGEYLVSYEKDEINISIYPQPDDEFLRFLRGETDTYYDIYRLSRTGSYNSADYGEIIIVEGSDEDLYTYFAGTQEQTIYIKFGHNYGYQLSPEQCEELLKQFIK